MENNLIRSELLFGTTKNIIGNIKADLVLESLGKIYLKTGQKTRVLDDIFKLIDKVDDSNVSDKILITDNLSFLKYPGEGFLIFDIINLALYISYDSRYVLISDNLDKFNQILDIYVKKEGDVMSGQLTIKHNGAPLIVASSELVKNFNANYLNGYTDSSFTKKDLDEYIYGCWSFENDTNFNKHSTFNDVATFNKDVTISKSIGSEYFISGYQGLGWRLEGDTNTLTIDYLVVRKAMMVYELIVNRIKATNGSLWVTDSGEIETAYLSGNGIGVNIWELNEDKGEELLFTNYDYIYDLEGQLNRTDLETKTLSITNIINPIFLIYENSEYINVNIYDKYFRQGNLYIVNIVSDTAADFQLGDLIRCLKFQNNIIKYYDGLVVAILTYNTYAIKIANSVFDKYSEIEYDESGKIITNIEKTEVENSSLTHPEAKDLIVRIGNIFNPDRLNSVFITSSDHNSPYIQTMSEINRPDYNVVYNLIHFKKVNNRYLDKENVYYDYIDNDNFDKLLLSNNTTISDYTLNNINEIPVTYNNSVKVRLGNLNGIVDENFKDVKPHGYGLFADNVFLKGEFYLNNGLNVIEFSKELAKIESENVSLIAKNSISDDLQKVGIFMNAEGNPDYNGANIVLTGENTYIDSTVTIGTNELIAKDDDENSLVINKETSVDFSKVRCIDWTKLNQEVELNTSNWSINSNISADLHTEHIDDKYSYGYHKGLFNLVKALSVLYFLGASQVLINGLWYNISALKYAPNHFGFTSGPNYYISNRLYRGVKLYRADYVRCHGVVYDGVTYEGDYPCLLLINAGVNIQYEMATGNIDSSLYALVDGSYVKANYFVPYAIYSSDGLTYILDNPNNKSYHDEEIVTILYTSIGSVADISDTSSITGYKDNKGNQYSLTTFEPIGSIVTFFYTFKGADNTTLFAKSPKVYDTFDTQLKIYKHGWLSKKPTSIDDVLSLQTNPTTTVSINTDSNSTYYYACMVQDMGGQFESVTNYKTEVLFLRTLTEELPSTSGITPQGFTFVSPNKQYFISFSDGAFKVGSTSTWVTISNTGIYQTKSMFKVDNVTDKVFCNTSIEDVEVSIHDFS